MDRITSSLLNEFVQDNGLEDLRHDQAFEHFCGALVLSEHHSELVQTGEITVGAGNDCGIDCIAIIVNGTLVTNPEEIGDLDAMNGYIDATFIFIQAERSSSFDSAKIGSFGFGVKDFFDQAPSLPRNNEVAIANRVGNEVFNRSANFGRGNPRCMLFYATTGRWTEDANLVARRDAVIQDLEATNLFRSVQFDCLGAAELQSLYRGARNAVSTQVTFVERATMPEIPGVEQAYVGVLPALDFLRLIQTQGGEIHAGLFYDNVRSWQEWNPVNTEIKETLENQDRRVFFPLLNNGVTIVARRVSATANRFLIEDYQIVNGCQTSFVLHEARESLTDDVRVPIRLIATDDSDIRNAIIKATNRQTAVADDQFFALTEFPKKLELHFPSFEAPYKLYYERRSRQYSNSDGVEKVRVVDLRTLVRAFASMFIGIPHRTTRNFKALLRTVGTDIFNSEHRLDPYYAAAFAHYRLEYLFRSQVIPSEYKPARYHMHMAFRLLCNPSPLPRMNSHEMDRYCRVLITALWDDTSYRDLYLQCAALVNTLANGDLDRDNIRTEPFTQALLNHFAVS